MASHRETVMLAGRLRGMGRDVECSVNAVRVSLPNSYEYEYARMMILNEPKDLPDGQYEVTSDGRTSKVQRKFGAWIAGV